MKKTVFLFLSVISLNTYAFNVFHPIKSIEKEIVIAGVVTGVGLLTAKAFFDFYINHPEKAGNYISNHPEQIDEITDYTNKKIATAKTQEQQQKYINFKEELGLGMPAIAWEQDPEWQATKQEVETAFAEALSVLQHNNQLTPSCNLNVAASLLGNKKAFDQTVNAALPKVISSPMKIADVSSFKNLKDNYKKDKKYIGIPLEQDHIPSYAALEKYFTNHGIKVNFSFRTNSVGKKEKIRDDDLEYNATTIAIPKGVHMKGRTWGGYNTETMVKNDANNLLLATIKDVTTTALNLKINSQYGDYRIYIENAKFIFARNKMLCLYDVK